MVIYSFQYWIDVNKSFILFHPFWCSEYVGCTALSITRLRPLDPSLVVRPVEYAFHMLFPLRNRDSLATLDISFDDSDSEDRYWPRNEFDSNFRRHSFAISSLKCRKFNSNVSSSLSHKDVLRNWLSWIETFIRHLLNIRMITLANAALFEHTPMFNLNLIPGVAG